MQMCSGCGQPVKDGEPTVTLVFGVAKMGKKSGRMYTQPAAEPETIHVGCMFRRYYPDYDKEVYDAFYNRVKRQVREEELEDIKNVAYQEVASDVETLCPECREQREDPDTPPEEYHCDECGSPLAPICPDCGEESHLVDTSEDDDEEIQQAC